MNGRIIITTGDFDTSRYPCPPLPVEPSETECRHTPIPENYHGWYEWCEQASKTHDQIECPKCGRWSIWLPKKIAREINKRRRREEKEFLKMTNKLLAAEYRRKADKLDGKVK